MHQPSQLSARVCAFITSLSRFILQFVTCFQNLGGAVKSPALLNEVLCLWSFVGEVSGMFIEWAGTLQLDRSVCWGPSLYEPALRAALHDLMTWILRSSRSWCWAWLSLCSDISLPSISSMLLLLMRVPLECFRNLPLMFSPPAITLDTAVTQLCSAPPNFISLLCCLACEQAGKTQVTARGTVPATTPAQDSTHDTGLAEEF